jgi:peptidoglycan-associated lipoprotein
MKRILVIASALLTMHALSTACLNFGECSVDEDCSGGDVCSAGVCVECESDDDCDEGETCDGNECVAGALNAPQDAGSDGTGNDALELCCQNFDGLPQALECPPEFVEACRSGDPVDACSANPDRNAECTEGAP